MILRKWIIGSVRANESEIADGIKLRYLRRWIDKYRVQVLTDVSIAEVHHNRAIVKRSFKKLLANCE